jgi:hypothetical protein
VNQSNYKLLSYAAVSDITAFSALMIDNSIIKFFTFLIMHLIASIIVAFVIYNIFPKKYKFQKHLVIFFIFLFAFFIPFISYIGFLVFNRILKEKEDSKKHEFKHLEIDKLLILDEIQLVKRIFGEGGLVTYIKNKDLDPDLRLKAFLIISEIISPKTIEFLKLGLSDTIDEIRLLSFSLINNLEKKINNEIFKIKELLKKENKPEWRFKLAKLNWELIYLRLVDDTFKKILIEEIFKYLEGIENKEANLLRVKIYLLLKDLEAVEKVLKKMDVDMETVPYFIELAYYKRDFEKLRELMKQYPDIRFINKFYFIYRLWNDN